MAVTRSWEFSPAVQAAPRKIPIPPERRRETWWLLGASLIVAAGLALALLAKTEDFAAQQQRLDQAGLLDLNAAASRDQLLPFLQVYSGAGRRESVADAIWSYLEIHRPLPNIGALARLPVTQAGDRLPLSNLKPFLVVRTPAQFWRECAAWLSLYLAAFWAVHFAWRIRRFKGDPAILPALHLLTGIGLILAVSLRDPLRDTLEFGKFAWGCALGCLLLLLPLTRAFQYRNYSRWVYTPLLLSFALFGLLIQFGSGPTGSESKVNLGPFQPVEAIKVLLVLFLAGYFAARWEWLRDLREKVLVPRWLRWLDLPRFGHALPVLCGVGCALALFFLLKDMGPALVTGFLFLVMFAVARGRAGLAVLGVAALAAGVAVGCHYGVPHTVVDRVSMWLSPWDNDVRGGDQLAHSLWAFSTGGPWGSGPGWGDPAMIPAGHTDLVLPAIAEEWGLSGVAAVFLLFALLAHRAFRIALDAPDEYAMFVAIGFGALISLEMLVISAGVLGAIPLSGVVSPFLSNGNTAMLANFLIFAVLLSLSSQPPGPELPAGDLRTPFAFPVRMLGLVLGACALALAGRAAYYQVLHDQEYLMHEVRVIAEDGVKRAQYNPRLNSLARAIPRGAIHDRNGLLLATSSWSELEKHRDVYEKLGVSIDQACSRLDRRHYPFGAATAHLLGDLRTGENFHAANASLIERDQNARLQGYGSYRELAPLARFRHQRANPGMQALLARDRDVRASIDMRLQLEVARILRKRLQPANKQGAVVVMDPASGDVLALASFPAPSGGGSTPAALLDRARYGQYPPGSTFKLVTAMAALRLDPNLAKQTFSCRRLGDGRVGTVIPGWRRPIRDDIGDSAHGTLGMERAITVSCNAWFAQLGVYKVGAESLRQTADLLGIPAGEIPEIKKMMPFAAYGQGPVLVTPFKMARVAATIAGGGSMPQGRWVLDANNTRRDPPSPVVPPESAAFLAAAMRSVVTGGTARRTMAGLDVPVAGKTGTAQMDEGLPHSWFAGFAPYDGAGGRGRIAFAVVVEHGGYGSQFAAPIARQIVESARDLGLFANYPERR
ncbi:MAG TPA: FtsW/RodA/SpoVE family cell cycle protein [Bryobacteraceae bacterium]|nr:FtsW/RodA/SpoVE family cell cycle protein [Bryobacteraceae bacterium]